MPKVDVPLARLRDDFVLFFSQIGDDCWLWRLCVSSFLVVGRLGVSPTTRMGTRLCVIVSGRVIGER